jgi:single-strand DNA-binding protein
MSGVNKCILIGRVGKDPEVKTIQSGASVANFSLATSESYKKENGEKVQQTTWHNLVMWRGLADVAGKHVKKGDLLYIEGKIQNRSYEKDGVTKYITEILVNNMTMLGSKGSGGSSQREEPHNAGHGKASGFDELPQTELSGGGTDDLPF